MKKNNFKIDLPKYKIFLVLSLTIIFGFSEKVFAGPNCTPNTANGDPDYGCYIYCANQPTNMYNSAGEVVNHNFYSVSGGWLVNFNVSSGVYYIYGGGGSQSVAIINGTYGCYSPSYSLNLSNSSPSIGESVTVSWSTTGVSSCTVTGNGNTWSGVSGSQSSGAINQTTTFTLSCSWPGGTISQQKTATIASTPIITLNTSPSKVDNNGTTNLTWLIKEADLKNCSNSSTLGNWNMTSLSGTQEIQNISQSQTFSISCSNSYGTTNASTSVSVNTRLFALPISVARGGSSLLSWISSLGSVCTLTNNAGYSYTGEATDHNLVYGVGAYTLSCKAKDEKSSTAKISIYRKNGLRCTK